MPSMSATGDSLRVSWNREAGHTPEVFGSGPSGAPASSITCLAVFGRATNLSALARDVSVGADESAGKVIEALYMRYGLESPGQVEGTCSFVIWDHGAQQLVAVAARTGNHRLYFLADHGALHVGPTVESLLPLLSHRVLDEESLARHLSGRAIPAGSTFFSSIRALVPGEALVASREDVRWLRYWNLELGSTLALPSDHDYVSHGRELLSDVIGSHLPDGPAAFALSGGWDSCALALSARRAAPDKDLAALRLRFEDIPAADESAQSEEVAGILGLRDFPVDGGSLWPLSDTSLPETRPGSPLRLLYSELWSAMLSHAGNEGIETVMVGIGGDEGFGGILPYFDLLRSVQLRELTTQLRHHAADSGLSPSRLAWKKLLRPLGGDVLRAVRGWRRTAVPWLSKRLRKWVRVDELPGYGRFAPLTARVKRLQLLREPTIIHACEELSLMAAPYGVEVCSPLADHRIAEFCLSLPPQLMGRAGRDKYVLRSLVSADLPDTLTRKLGKTSPMPLAWRGLRDRERGKVEGLLKDMRLADLGLVDPARLRAYYEEFVALGRDDVLFWPTLTCESWLREHF